jgi:hypothetical protein
LSKLKGSRDEVGGMWRKVVKQIRRMRMREIWMGKMEGIKRAPLLYVATSSSPTLAIMILQMTIGFPYFHLRINMLKWLSSIFGFKEKFPTTFIIHQLIETSNKVFAICELFFLKI